MQQGMGMASLQVPKFYVRDVLLGTSSASIMLSKACSLQEGAHLGCSSLLVAVAYTYLIMQAGKVHCAGGPLPLRRCIRAVSRRTTGEKHRLPAGRGWHDPAGIMVCNDTARGESKSRCACTELHCYHPDCFYAVLNGWPGQDPAACPLPAP